MTARRIALVLVAAALSRSAWAPPNDIEAQSRARWARLTRDQRAALVQWTLGSGEMVRFVERNREDLEGFLRIGVEDDNFRAVESAARDSLARFESGFARKNPSLTGDRLRAAMELSSEYWRLRKDVRLVELVKNFRTAAFVLTGEPVTAFRLNSPGNRTPSNAEPVRNFLATTTRLQYARAHRPDAPAGGLVRIQLANPLVAVPPDFAGDAIGTFLEMEGFTEFYPRYRENHRDMPRHPPFDNTGLMASQREFWRLFYGDFVLAFYEANHPREVANPRFHHGTTTEWEIVLVPGNTLQAQGTRGRGPNALSTLRCYRTLDDVTEH